MLTDQQKLQIKSYLGYQTLATDLDDLLGTVDGYAELQIETYLSEIAAIEVLLNSTSRDVAGLTQVNKVSFKAGQNIRDLRNLANSYVYRMASDLGVDVVSSPFEVTSGGIGPGFTFFG